MEILAPLVAQDNPLAGGLVGCVAHRELLYMTRRLTHVARLRLVLLGAPVRRFISGDKTTAVAFVQKYCGTGQNHYLDHGSAEAEPRAFQN